MRETASLTSMLRKLERLKTRADAELAYADKALAAAKTDEARTRAEDLKQKAAARAAEPNSNTLRLLTFESALSMSAIISPVVVW